MNDDNSISEGSEKPTKRVAKKQPSSQPDGVIQTENLTVANTVPSKQGIVPDNAMETSQIEADAGASTKRMQPCAKLACVRSGYKPKCFVKFTDRQVFYTSFV